MKQLSLCVLSLMCALAAACQSPFNGAKDAWSEQGAHPITVDTQLMTQQFQVSAGDFTLRQDDRDRFSALAADYRDRGVGKLTIISPEGSANSAVAVQVAAEMTAIAREHGVDVRDVDVTGYHAPLSEAGAPIILTYTVYQAMASACANWSKNYAFAPRNRITPDHGCATQNNLAAMVEHPRDLIAPRGEEAADQGRRQVTLDKYRKGEVTAAQKDDQASGSVSEVNQ